MPRVETTFMTGNLRPDSAVDGPEPRATPAPAAARRATPAARSRSTPPTKKFECTFQTPLRPDQALPADGAGAASPSIVCTGPVSRASPASDADVSPAVLKLHQFGRKRRSQSVPPPKAEEAAPPAIWSRSDLQKAKGLAPPRAPAAASPPLGSRWPRTRRFLGFRALDPLND